MSDKINANVPLKQYTITTGYFDNYKIVAWLAGSKDKNIEDLYAAFLKEYFVNYDPNFPAGKTIADMRAHKKNSDYKYDAIRKLQRAGYEGNTVVALFISWLKSVHEFQEQASNEVWIES